MGAGRQSVLRLLRATATPFVRVTCPPSDLEVLREGSLTYGDCHARVHIALPPGSGMVCQEMLGLDTAWLWSGWYVSD